MKNSKKDAVDTNYEPSKKPSKLFDDCKDIKFHPCCTLSKSNALSLKWEKRGSSSQGSSSGGGPV